MPTNAVDDIADNSQKAIRTALSIWTDTVQGLAGTVSACQGQWPAVRSAVEQYFDLAEKTLAGQRAVAMQLLSGTVDASVAVSEQTRRAGQSVSAHTANATEAVVDNATETTHAVVDEVAAAAPGVETPTDR